MREQSRREGNGTLIQYCFGRSWYYLCSGDTGWTQAVGTLVCRQLGYSDQGKGIPPLYIIMWSTNNYRSKFRSCAFMPYPPGPDGKKSYKAEQTL